MRSLLLILSLLAASRLAHAQIRVAGDTKAKPHRMVRLTTEGVPDVAALLWEVSDEDKCDVEEWQARLLLTAPPGAYKVKLRAILVKDGKTLIETARATVTIEGDKPPADPAKPPSEPPAQPPRHQGGPRQRDLPPSHRQLRLQRDHRRPPAPRRPLGGAYRVALLRPQRRPRRGHPEGRPRAESHRRRARDARPDLAWLITDEPQDKLPYALLAMEEPERGTRVWHRGYGVDRPGNKEEGTVSTKPGRDGRVTLRLSASGGDSGGGIFREDTGELVAVVCCGSFGTLYGGFSREAIRLRPPH